MGGVQTPAGNAPRLPVRQPVRAAAFWATRRFFETKGVFLNQHQYSVPPVVAAIIVRTEQQHRAFCVVDAVDDLDSQLGAYRAVEQLAANDRLIGDEGLPQLRRSDLAQLLSVLNANLQDYSAKAREAALFSAVGGSSGANPV